MLQAHFVQLEANVSEREALLHGTADEGAYRHLDTQPSADYSWAGKIRGNGSLRQTSSDSENLTDVDYSWLDDLLLTATSSRAAPNAARTLVRYVELYVLPVILLVGLGGNVTSFGVFAATSMRKLSSSVYLALLSLADISFLLCVSISWGTNIGWDLYQRQGWCQMFVYLTHVSSFLSVWYVVSFTVERYIAVHFPLRRNHLCTTRRARLVVLSLAVLALVAYSFSIWTSGVIVMGGVRICGPVPEYYATVSILHNVDTMVTLILPFVIISVLNVRITLTLVKFKRERRRLGLRRNISTRGRCVADADDTSANASTVPRTSVQQKANGPAATCHLLLTAPATPVMGGRRPSTTRGGGAGGNRPHYPRSQAKVTRMLLIVSSIFLLLNLPRHVTRTYSFVITVTSNSFIPNESFILWEKVFQFLYYVHFSLTVFLYSVLGKNFRTVLCALWRRARNAIKLCTNKPPSLIGGPTVRLSLPSAEVLELSSRVSVHGSSV